MSVSVRSGIRKRRVTCTDKTAYNYNTNNLNEDTYNVKRGKDGSRMMPIVM